MDLADMAVKVSQAREQSDQVVTISVGAHRQLERSLFIRTAYHLSQLAAPAASLKSTYNELQRNFNFTLISKWQQYRRPDRASTFASPVRAACQDSDRPGR